MIRVAVLGALGRMGREVCAAVAGDADTMLVAAVDPASAGERVPAGANTEVRVSGAIDAVAEAGAEVAVDFTHPDAVMDNVRWCVARGIDVVVGTTGLRAEDHREIDRLLGESGRRSGVLVAPNFAIGAVLMMRFAAQASRFLPSVEIVEMHHDAKADAPSGTALRTAEEVARVRGDAPQPRRESVESVPGVRGGAASGVPIHSVRLRGLVAHQEVLLGGSGETLTIRHDSLDRSCFMPGVLLAVKQIGRRPGLTVGLEPLLDL